MTFFSKLINNFEHRAKRKALIQLRSMSERQLTDCGISQELLSQGIKAWPWKSPEEATTALRFDQIPDLVIFPSKPAVGARKATHVRKSAA